MRLLVPDEKAKLYLFSSKTLNSLAYRS